MVDKEQSGGVGKLKLEVDSSQKVEDANDNIKKPAEKSADYEDIDPERYFEAVGRRKESVARVRLFTRKSSDVKTEKGVSITINDLPHDKYIKESFLVEIIESPLRKMKSLSRFRASVHVNGGGIRGQADAIMLGIARALVLFDENFSKKDEKSRIFD